MPHVLRELRQELRCGIQANRTCSPFTIIPLDADGEHSIKNVVALCTDCLAALQNEPDPKTIKELKRRTRIKIYDSLEVVRKKKVRGRRRFSGRLR